MRFHIGYSFKIKHLLKWLLPIIVGLLAYFGIANMEVLALDNDATDNNLQFFPNCESGGVVDMITCSAFEGYSTITSKDTQCNIAMGRTLTNNVRTRQVNFNFDYDDSLLSMVQTSNAQYNHAYNNVAVRFKFDDDLYDTPLYLSYQSFNLNDDACISSSCPPANIFVYACPDDTYTNCYTYSAYSDYVVSNSFDNNIRWQVIKNYVLYSPNEVKRRMNAQVPYPYLQINYINGPTNSNWVPTIGASWNYGNIYLSDTPLLPNEDVGSNPHLTNYCEGSGGPNFVGGTDSITDQVNQAINDTLTGPNGVLTNPSLPDIDNGIFSDLVYHNTGLASLIVLPIELLTTISSDSETCNPLQIDLSSITRRWGNSDYVLTLPCIRQNLRTMLGNWYDIFDTLIAAILFYYFAMNLILKVNDILSGVDDLPYFYESSSRMRTTRPSNVGVYNKSTGEVID